MHSIELLEYHLKTDRLERGKDWINLGLKNISQKTLNNITVNLHSIEPYFLSVMRGETKIKTMKPEDTQKLCFQVTF